MSGSRVPPREGHQARTEPVRVMQVIARMNIGGPAYYVSLLAGRLDPSRFSSLLVFGRTGPGEGSFAGLAEEEGCRVETVDSLGPQIRPGADLRAVIDLARVIRRWRPHIVHTHTAKAGALGRIAAYLSIRPRPLILHTYHGHVLEGYFGPLVSSGYRLTERVLARVSDRLLTTSEATVDDLVRLGVGSRSDYRVVPACRDLKPFLAAQPAAGADLRRQLGLRGPEDLLLTSVGRLVPIKRLDVLLRAMAKLRDDGRPLSLVIVGDGESRPELERLAGELRLTETVTFVGYMTDVVPVAAASDIAVLSSDNEGTPVSLIEAGAAGVPAAATRVGGVPDVVNSETGILVPAGDHDALAAAITRLAGDASLREAMGDRARAHVRDRFGAERLIRDVEAVYDELLSRGDPVPA